MADAPPPIPTPPPSPPSQKETWTTVPASQALVEAPRSDAPPRKPVKLSVVRARRQAPVRAPGGRLCALCGESSKAPMGKMALGPLFVEVCRPCADAASGALRLFTKLFASAPATPGRRRKP